MEDEMEAKYSKELKSCVVYEICELGRSTSKTAKEFNIPVKTVEKWITAYNKNPKVFNITQISDKERIQELESENKRLLKDNEILKKTLVMIAKKE